VPETLETTRFVIWTLRSIARRERRRPDGARRLTDPKRTKWAAFAGSAQRLHAGDFVKLLIENDVVTRPFGLRLSDTPSADAAEGYIDDALTLGAWSASSSGAFLEALAVDFGREPLPASRRQAFGPIRSDQRILEFPSTAGRVAAAVADVGAPIETYVTYLVVDEVDEFIVGLVMAEFERRAAPPIIRAADLERGDVHSVTTSFTRAATLIPNDPLVGLLPRAAVGDRVIVL
jgi:hypothetical protein